MHMVGWDKVCRPKRDGGLGIYATKPRNKALLAKLNWRLHVEREALWAKTFRAKYWPDGPNSTIVPSHRYGSNNWRGIKLGHEVFEKGIRWVVNNGLSVSFWKDKWVGEKPIREIIQGPLTLEEENFMVGHVIEGATHWDLTKLSLVLPSSIVECIRATHLCTLNSMGDQLAWDSSDGEFNLRKAYQLACKPDLLPTQDAQVKWLWQPFSSPRVLFFLWQCYHDSVPVKCTLAHRGINISTQCPRCSCPNESLIHALRDCPDSTYFWNKFIPSFGLSSFIFIIFF
jgi:hypothetical protein